MRANLDRTNGLVLSEALTMALAPKIGRAEAYKIVQAAVKQVTEQGKDLRQAVLENPQARQHLTEAEIDQALDPASYLGSANLFIDRALAGYRRLNPAPDR